MSFLRSLLYGLWRGLDVLRRFLHLLVLLVIFGFVVGALRSSVPTVPAKAALLVEPEGELVEQSTGDPIKRAIQEARGQGHAETLLWDLTDSIRAAAKDKRIPVVAIDLEKFGGAGQATLEELARALREVVAGRSGRYHAGDGGHGQTRYLHHLTRCVDSDEHVALVVHGDARKSSKPRSGHS